MRVSEEKTYRTSLSRRGLRFCVAVVTLALLSGSAAADSGNPELERGFRQLYNLDFAAAQQTFQAWEVQNPGNPMGAIGEASGVLFSELDRLGVLESQFYATDAGFLSRQKLTPDAAKRQELERALERAEHMARQRLAQNSKDVDGLLAMTLSNGLQADYAALIEKRNFASLHYTKEATAWSQQLLASDPSCHDAHLAGGISRYIVGSMPMPVRWLLSVGGVPGDKQAGIAELQLTAEKGEYLAPFARILLAIAYVREKQTSRARELLTALRDEFPKNPLFQREIARLDGGH